jgi:hypothetical protein
VIVNVCPAATSTAPPDRFWAVLAESERLGEWTDAKRIVAGKCAQALDTPAAHLIE